MWKTSSADFKWFPLCLVAAFILIGLLPAWSRAALTGESIVIPFSEAAGSSVVSDQNGTVLWYVNDRTASITGDGFFHGDGLDNYLLLSGGTAFEASRAMSLEARIRPASMGSGETQTIQRIFARDTGGNYQMSVWRNPTWDTYNPPDGVGSIAFWVMPVNSRGGQIWKPVLTDYSSCPIVAGHWYRVRVVWNSDKIDGPPGDIFVDDQGIGGDDIGENWTGYANCTDADQSLVSADRQLFQGDEIVPASSAVAIGVNVNNSSVNLFDGLIDWIIWRSLVDYSGVTGVPAYAVANSNDPYPGGFSWNLLMDYTAGTVKNSTAGNPDSDANGNPVWSYEWINAKGQTMGSPWYATSSQLLTWDSYQYNPLTWAAINNGTVNMNQWNMNFHYSSPGCDKVPVVRWTNPTGETRTVDMSGRYTISWWGLNPNPEWPSEPDYWDSYLVGSPVDVKFVIGFHDKSENTTTVLYTQTYSKPRPGETTCVAPNYGDCDHVDVIADLTVEVEPGDSIFWTARPAGCYNDRNRWITINHNNITMTLHADHGAVGPAVIMQKRLYAVEPSGTIQRLVGIDPETLAVETVLSLQGPTGFRANALAFNPDGELFGWDNIRGQLFRIDLENGDIIHVGAPTDLYGIAGLAFDRSGKLYGISGGTDSLYGINPQTGAATLIGSLGVDIKHNGLAVEFTTDKLFAVSGQDADFLLEINKATGQARVIGSLGTTDNDVGVEFSPVTGELFAVRNANLLMKLDRDTGLAMAVGTLEGVITTNLAAPWPVEIRTDRLYAVEPSENSKRLISIDPVTAAVKTVLNLSGPDGMQSYALAFSPSGELYGWDTANGLLYYVDLKTGEIRHIGTPGAIVKITGLAFDRAGNLYGLRPEGELLSINPSTGTVSIIGPLGIGIGPNGLAIDFATNTLYAVSGNSTDYLLRIDKNSGTATVIGSLGVNYPGVGAEFLAETGELFAVRNNNILMKVNPSTGTAIEVGTLERVATVNLAASWTATRHFEIGIDIRPNALRNMINLAANGKVKVAILGGRGFDVADIDLYSIVFAGASPDGMSWIKDDNLDGHADLEVRFNIIDLSLTPSSTEACLNGELSNGSTFSGCDTVTIVQNAVNANSKSIAKQNATDAKNSKKK